MVKILYIEDEETLAQLVKRRLVRQGYDVELAASGELGLELLATKEIDVVIIDYQLPQMNGLDVLQKLYQTEPVMSSIMVSGQDDIRIAVEAMNLGCKDYLVKEGHSYLELLPVRIEAVIAQRKLVIEKQQAEHERLLAQQALARAQSLAHIGSWEWNVGDDFARWSSEEYRLFGLEPDDYPEKRGVSLSDYQQYIHPEDIDLVENMAKRSLQEDNLEFEYRIKLADGKIRWLHARNDIEKDDEGNLIRCFGTTQNITERKQVENQLLLAQQVFDTTVEGIMVTDENEKIISVNPAFTLITGYEQSEAIGQTPKLLQSGKHDAIFYKTMQFELDTQGRWAGEIWNRKKQGEIYPEWLSISVIKTSHGDVEQYVSVFSDISKHKKNEQLIQYQANYDALTGLANRNLFNDRLENSLKIAQREQGLVVLLFLDLDRFKWVNDTLGHRVGDLLLKEVAVRLKSVLRDSDTISRLGGDEFTIVLTDIDHAFDAEMIAVKVLAILAKPFQLEQQEVSITTSIGLAVYPTDGESVDLLYRHADNAMYAAKEAGRNQFSFFTAKMQKQAETRLNLLNELRRAIENEEFELYYQPVINTATNTLYGAEALIRWNHPEKGVVSPLEFIPLAEETGLIRPIGTWVIDQAIAQLKQWNLSGYNIHVAINKSSKQFQSGECAADLYNQLKIAEVKPQQLTIEVTESVLMEMNDDIRQLFQDYRQAGFTISLDDFGTGYSSLSYLRKFPVNILKIDRSFIIDVIDNKEDAILVETIILMGHKLGIMIVAEGVETEEQRHFLRQNNCDYLQGYLYSPPIPAAEFEQRFIINKEGINA